MNEIEINALIDELAAASQVYYQEDGESALTDDEFDSKLAFLAKHVSEFPELFTEGSMGFKLLENEPSLGSKPVAKPDEIITHMIPMLSLKKAKTEDELVAWTSKLIREGAVGFQLQAKLDGFALCARYVDGKLTLLATRGDGVEGEDVTYLMHDPQVTVVGLPAVLPNVTGELEVRGELFLSDDQFNTVDDIRVKLTGERFKNSRNAVVGLMKKAKLGVDYPVTFTFATYSIYSENGLIDLSSNLAQDFKSVIELTQDQDRNLTLITGPNTSDLYKAVKAFGMARENFHIPTDGVVVKPCNEGFMHAKLGNTSHHPVSQIAFKYPGARAETVVEAIDITVGKTGKVTPIARVRPVDLAGIVIANTSLHNFNWVYEKDVRVGSIVEITRANDVIPQIATVLVSPPDSELITVPTTCPICAEALAGVKDENVWPPRTLRCNNQSCPSRDFFALKAAVSKNCLDIDGMSEVTLTHLNDIGRINTVDELFTLTVDELETSQLGVSSQGNPRRLGRKRAEHIINHIEKAKRAPLYKLLVTLNITGLGNRMAKDLVKNFNTIEAIMAATYEDIYAIDGMGDVRARTLVDGFAHRAELIQRMKNNGVEFTPPAQPDENENIFANMAFAISGTVPEPFANRGAWVEFIESKGGKFDSSPKATTSFMIGDRDDTSSKIKKARSLNIEFLTAEEFTARFVN